MTPESYSNGTLDHLITSQTKRLHNTARIVLLMLVVVVGSGAGALMTLVLTFIASPSCNEPRNMITVIVTKTIAFLYASGYFFGVHKTAKFAFPASKLGRWSTVIVGVASTLPVVWFVFFFMPPLVGNVFCF